MKDRPQLRRGAGVRLRPLLLALLGAVLIITVLSYVSTALHAGTRVPPAEIFFWNDGTPKWRLIEQSIGSIESGGLATIALPADSPDLWSIVLWVANPDELASAYQFWNPLVQVRRPDTSSLIPGISLLFETLTTRDDFRLGTSIPDAVSGERTTLVSLDSARAQFIVHSSDGAGMDDSGAYQTNPELITRRVFLVGFGADRPGASGGAFKTLMRRAATPLSHHFVVRAERL